MTAITDVDVPAIVAAMLAKATVPGPLLRRTSDELRTWFLLAVHPDDEPAMTAMVAADPWLQATVTVQAGRFGPDRGTVWLIDQDKLKHALEADAGEFQFREARLPPSWARWWPYVQPVRPANLLVGLG